MYERLHDEFEYYITNQDDFVRRYNGKVIALRDHEVVGVYESEWKAAQETAKLYPPGTFIVQRVSPGPEAYTVNVASNFVLLENDGSEKFHHQV